MEIEKNDVDINRLFTWGRAFEVENSDGEVEALVFMRLLGDADANRVRVHALRKSGELRKKLLDVDSGERFALIRSIDELTKEDLVNYVLIFSMREINNEAIKNVTIPKPKQPKSNASLAKMEKYQQEVDEWPERLKKELDKYIKKGVDNLKKVLETETKESLYRRYVKTLIDEFCEQEAIRAYRDMEIYLGCYKDDSYTERFFDSFEQFENLDTSIKNQFRVAYQSLDIPTSELKKLREATL